MKKKIRKSEERFPVLVVTRESIYSVRKSRQSSPGHSMLRWNVCHMVPILT